MMIQINYDLNKAGQNYTGLIEKIKSIANGYAKPCESCWLIITTKSPLQVYNDLKPFIDNNDLLMVSRFYSNDYYGWLRKDVIAWIEKHKIPLREIAY
jgi:hypothetical protein